MHTASPTLHTFSRSQSYLPSDEINTKLEYSTKNVLYSSLSIGIAIVNKDHEMESHENLIR